MRKQTLFLLIFGILLVIVVVVLAQDRDPADPAPTDILHSVPLEDIIFDDFDSTTRSLRYTDATAADIERLRDRIRPFCRGELSGCLDIRYESVDDTNTWLGNSALVLGYVADDGQAYAYPFLILNFHEIVNDTLADVPVLISYCPLCNSAIIYSREVAGEVLIFGNTSALYQSDMVMYDDATDSFWFQVEGEAIVGAMTGTRLEILPSQVMPWSLWRDIHPDTLVLERPGDSSQYARNPFGGYASVVNGGRFAFPVSPDVVNDTRLRPADNVLVVVIDDDAVAYPIAEMGDAATHDTVGGESIVVLTREDGLLGAAFLATLPDGTIVDLEYADGLWRDTVTDSVFDLSGMGVSGELAGQQLTPLATRFSFWFAAVAALPTIEVYQPE